MTVNVWVTEYRELVETARGVTVPIPKEPSIAVQKNGYTISAQISLNAETRIVRIVADADIYVAFGTNPTATVSSTKIPSGTVEWRGVTPDVSPKVAFYDGSS